MSVKLSELLETATNSIGAAARRDEQFCNTAALLWSQESALRAIAPALVEIISNVRYFHEATCPLSHCAACALFAAMTKAGVTCE